MAAQRGSGPEGLDEAEMAARAAWLHFVGGLTQSDVARRLGVPTTRAHRYIARAQSLGLVRVVVDVQAASCAVLEERLRAAYGLGHCRVAMELPEPGPLPVRALAAAGSDWLTRVVTAGEHRLIGVSHGRTIAAAVEALARVDAAGVRFVSLLGGLTRSLAANPYDVIHRLAERTGAEAYLMPAPLFVDSAADRDLMAGQTILSEVMELMRQASLAIVGIGDLEHSVGSVLAERDGGATQAGLRAAGARAEILGQFLDAEGRILETPLDGRVMAVPLDELRGREVVAIAGGAQKREAIQAALRSGLLTGLIVDEATARSLVAALGDSPARAAE